MAAVWLVASCSCCQASLSWWTVSSSHEPKQTIPFLLLWNICCRMRRWLITCKYWSCLSRCVCVSFRVICAALMIHLPLSPCGFFQGASLNVFFFFCPFLFLLVHSVSRNIYNIFLSGWRDNSGIEGLTALIEDLSLVSSIHIRWFTTDCNSSSRDWSPASLWRHTWVEMSCHIVLLFPRVEK